MSHIGEVGVKMKVVLAALLQRVRSPAVVMFAALLWRVRSPAMIVLAAFRQKVRSPTVVELLKGNINTV